MKLFDLILESGEGEQMAVSQYGLSLAHVATLAENSKFNVKQITEVDDGIAEAIMLPGAPERFRLK